MVNLKENIDKFFKRKLDIEKLLSNSTALRSNELSELSKELSEIKNVTDLAEELDIKINEISDLEDLLKDKNSENEIKEMAKSELKNLNSEVNRLQQNLELSLIPKDKDDERNVIIEIRAGTGGDEAGLFALNLFNMYQKFSNSQKWKFEIMSISETGVGGYKEAHANITGNDVFGRLKFESGVHRVQRVPSTETNGRIHTSAATVAVLPEAEEVDVKIEEKDLRIDVFRSSGPGGQSVNTTDSAVRITHEPTGIVVSQQDEKSQIRNKEKGLKILRSRIYEYERKKKEDERSKYRKSKIGTGDRSERIRTYNFPQGRVTDHRINLTLHKLNEFMEGEIFDEMIENINLQAQEELMSAN